MTVVRRETLAEIAVRHPVTREKVLRHHRAEHACRPCCPGSCWPSSRQSRDRPRECGRTAAPWCRAARTSARVARRASACGLSVAYARSASGISARSCFEQHPALLGRKPGERLDVRLLDGFRRRGLEHVAVSGERLLVLGRFHCAGLRRCDPGIRSAGRKRSKMPMFADSFCKRSLGPSSRRSVRWRWGVRFPVGMPPETKFAKSGDISIAYQILGDGPRDLVLVPGWMSNIEAFWDEPAVARFLQRLASFSRLILFDKRGTGLSDRVCRSARSRDAHGRRAALSWTRSVPSARRSAAIRRVASCACSLRPPNPTRTTALITIGSYARQRPAPDYPWGRTH